MPSNKTEVSATPGGREIIITREFDAPIEKVWRAYTEPDIYIQWAGPKRLKGRIDDWDLKPGGRYGFTHLDTDGTEYVFHGFYHYIEDLKRIVRTFEFAGFPGHVSLEAATFEAVANGRSKVVGVSVYETAEDRDAMLQSGMEKGVVEGNERLDELLEKL